jgi:hypothetical protein
LARAKHFPHTYQPVKMEQTVCSETSAYKSQTPENYPEETHKTLYLIKNRIFKAYRTEDVFPTQSDLNINGNEWPKLSPINLETSDPTLHLVEGLMVSVTGQEFQLQK